MSSPADNRVICEQCGASLASAEAHCLNCMLGGGLDSTQTSETLTGTRFYQHYEIQTRVDGTLYELGRGAMGVTYKALDVNLHVPVALKVINARYSAQPEARARFLREARAAARLRHPNVASVFHYGTLERDDAEECFYAMEFVEGETLEARVRRDGPLPVQLALEVVLQVAQALAAAEKRGLIHRDLKPSNIMLAADRDDSGDAWVKVIDFGLAKAINADADENFATRGGFLGTPQFASPEQIDRQELDVRSDIYSLGVTLWFALTGELPFEGGSLAETRDRQLHRPLPIARLHDFNVPARVVALLTSMLAADPEQRPSSSAALCDAVRELRETRKPRHRMIPVALAFVIAASLALGYFAAQRSGSSPNDKSVAVLPLANLSEEKENAFFAEGIQDDVLTSLAKIKQLKVISRSSVLQYVAGSTRDLHAIGEQLGVSYVLEGSVRRAGDRVLVNVQLVDTRAGRQVWAERYDRTLFDALTLQAELATEIANALSAELDPGEKTRIQTKPTSNPDVYVLYLRARSYEIRPTYVLQDFQAAEALYEQAIAMDPQFALAHARLSSTLAYIYRNSTPTENLKRRAHAEADEALRLQPDLGEAHVARALCFYRIERDYDRSLEDLQIAARLLPNDSNVETTIAFIRRRQGQWAEAIRRLDQALAHDPRNAQIAQEIFTTHRMLRDWPAAARAADRAISFAPELPLLRIDRAYLDLWSKGDLAPLEATLASIPANVDPDGFVTWMRWNADMLARNFEAAEQTASGFGAEMLPSIGGAPFFKSYLQGVAALAAGAPDRAIPLLESARVAMEADVQKAPESAPRHARLALLYAYLGLKTEAIAAAKRTTEIQPESTDAYGGPHYMSYLALVYARTGETDQALALIERLLQTPGPVFYYEASMTLSELRLRCQWDPLRGDPRFEKILAGPEPPTRR